MAIGDQEFDFYFWELESWSRNLGRPCDVDALRRESWFHLVKEALEEVKHAVSAGATLILVDEDQLCAGPKWAGRKVVCRSWKGREDVSASPGTTKKPSMSWRG